MFHSISTDKFHHINSLLQQFYQSKKHLFKTNETTLTQNTNQVYNLYQNLIIQSNDLFSHIQEDLIVPTESYFTYSESIYRSNFEKIKQIFQKQTHFKSLLEKSKLIYLKAMYLVNQNSSNHMNKKDIFSGQTIISQQEKDNYYNVKAFAYNYEQLYKIELERYNIKIQEINKEYNEICTSFKKQEVERIYFIKSIIDKYKNIYHEYKILLEDFFQFINKNISSEICEREIKDITNKYFNKYENGIFPQEHFVTFDSFYNDFKGDYSTLNDFSCFEQNIIDPLEKENKLDKKQKEEHIKQSIFSLLSENEINKEQLAVLIDILDNDDNTMKFFLDTVTSEKKAFSIQIPNLKNLKHLSNIFSFISLQHMSVFEGKFEFNFKIIYLAERILFQNPKINNNQKTYLSALLSKNKFYSTKAFWSDIMELKLANKLEDHIKRLKKVNLPDEKKSKGLFSKIGRTLGITNEEQKKSLVYNSRLRKLIKNYSQLDKSKISILDSMASAEMCEVIKDSIPNFASFNFPSEESLDLIANLAQIYKLPKEHINYYVTYITVSTNTIRHILPNEKICTNAGTRVNRYKVTKKEDELYKVFSRSLKYLEYKDYINILLLNKELSNRLSKKVYKLVLQNPKVDNSIRLSIWKCILKVKDLKLKYPYEQLLQTVENSIKLHKIVEVDIARTIIGKSEDSEAENIKNKLINILKVIAVSNGNINYCQGMNYICEFLYELTQNEEETYYIFLGFFINTEYPLIFAKDLNRLKTFFYVFKRLISLYEPEIYSYFVSNSFDIQCSLPQWFITLFVSARQHLSLQELPIILIRILDSFIVSGWKALMKVGIKILDSYENELMKMKYDEMMEFLINDLLKSEFFRDNNIMEIEKCFEERAIKNKLIKNIENEFIQQEKINQSIEQ